MYLTNLVDIFSCDLSRATVYEQAYCLCYVFHLRFFSASRDQDYAPYRFSHILKSGCHLSSFQKNQANTASRSFDRRRKPDLILSAWALRGFVPFVYAHNCFWFMPVIFSNAAKENTPAFM